MARLQEPVTIKKKPIARRNTNAASFIDNVQNDAYLAEIAQLIDDRRIP
jgi:hypothetical protein